MSAKPAMRLVLVEWEDSFGCSPSWESLEASPSTLICQSVGWLLHDGEDCKTIVPHITDGGAGVGEQGCGDMTIPTTAIRRITDLPRLEQTEPMRSTRVLLSQPTDAPLPKFWESIKWKLLETHKYEGRLDHPDIQKVESCLRLLGEIQKDSKVDGVGVVAYTPAALIEQIGPLLGEDE